MTIDSIAEAPCFETTRRLLAALINEGLVHAVIKGAKNDFHRCLYLSRNDSSGENCSIVVQAAPGALIEDRNGEVLPAVQPSMLCPPVMVKGLGVENKISDPGDLFTLITPWFEDMASQQVLEEISRHLQNSGSNQG
jgi:hypothetical protein